MKPMEHGFNERQWLAYVDGTLDAGERARMDSHLDTCGACADQAAQLASWRSMLRAEGARLRDALRPSEGAIDSMLSNVLARIDRRKPEWTASEAIIVLRYLLDPICGPGAMGAAIDLALARSAGDARVVTGKNWRLFVANLSDAATLICGLAVGRLVHRAGVCLAVEEG